MAVSNKQSKVVLKQGTVVSNNMNKTIVVLVTRKYRHPLYRKIVRTNKRYYAHDPKNSCRAGDTVVIKESKPLSKTKRWALVEILERGEL